MNRTTLSAVFYLVFSSILYAQDYKPVENPESTESMKVYPDLTSGGNFGFVQLGPPEVPNAVATVTFKNTSVNGAQHSDTYPLTFEGLTVTITFEWSSGDDSVQVIVPPYFQVEPEGMVDVPEGETQLYHIYQLVG